MAVPSMVLSPLEKFRKEVAWMLPFTALRLPEKACGALPFTYLDKLSL